MKNNDMRIVKIQRTKKEAEGVKTILFEDDLSSSAEPGQFIMAWIPGVDEIPLSISSASGGLASVTVKEIGDATRAINRMRRGDLLGVRGPFGSYFKAVGRSALVVGGGIGIAPMLMLVERLLSRGVETTIIEGARTGREIIFKDRLISLQKEGDLRVIFTTDDGSYGLRGLATEAAESILSEGSFDVIYACGNESMIRRLFLIAEKHGIPMQASLERIMRCAVGICGSCVVGRYRVCRDGPVFDSKQLREIKGELGRFKRGFRGERVPIKE